MSDQPSQRSWLLRLVVAASVASAIVGGEPGLAAQSTEAQRERVAQLEAAVRTFGPREVKPLAPSANDTIEIGALVLRSERDLVPLATRASERAWQSLEDNYGRGAYALSSRLGSRVFVVSWPVVPNGETPDFGRVTLGSEYTTPTGRGWGSGSPVPANVDALADLIESNASSSLIGEFGDLSAWLQNRMSTDREAAFLELASSSNPSDRQCARYRLVACRALLGLDSPTVVFERRDGSVPRRDNRLSTAREGLLKLTLRLGGQQAPARFRSTRSPTLGPSLAAAAGIPLDSLVLLWRREFGQRTSEPVAPATSQLGSLVLITVVFVALATRKRLAP